MRMRGKFLLHFFGQLLLVILLMSVLVASFFYLDWRFSEAEANAGLTKATADSFEAWLDKTKTAHGMSMNFKDVGQKAEGLAADH